MIVKLDHFPQDRGKKLKIFETTTQWLHYTSAQIPSLHNQVEKVLKRQHQAPIVPKGWNWNKYLRPPTSLSTRISVGSSYHEQFNQNLVPKVCTPENFNIDTNKWWSCLNVPPASNMVFFGVSMWVFRGVNFGSSSTAPRSPKSSGLRPRSPPTNPRGSKPYPQPRFGAERCHPQKIYPMMMFH